MARSRREAQRERRRILVGTLAGLGALAIAAGAAWTWRLARGDALDPQTLCPAGGPRGQVVLLVDRTDPLTFTQRQAFDGLLRDVVQKRTAPGALLSVFVLGDDVRDTAKPLIELCNPGTGAGASELTANPAQLHRQYEERFLRPLMKEADALVASAPAKDSPIMEMLQLVGINGFRAHDVSGPRRLIVVSDMLHNTAQFSMYHGAVAYADFARTDYARRAQADLANVEVELHVLMNTPRLQTQRQIRFWEEWFEQAGARIVAVQPMEG